MAQTVTLQRGEVTLSHNTTSLVFTNGASGIATRLLIGYLSWTSNFSGVIGYCTVGVLRSGASSPNFNIIASTEPYSSSRTVSFSPHDTTGFTGVIGISQFFASTILFNETAAGIGTRPSSTQQNANVPARAMYNSNTIIGPSDEVHFAWYDNGSGNRAAVIQYCFSLITES